MIAREDLAEVFEEENLVRLDVSAAAGFSDADRQILTQVGLPRFAGELFTTEVVGRPRLFDVEEFTANGVAKQGHLHRRAGGRLQARFFLDERDGFVVLMALTSGGGEAEVVNSSLRDFLEFLYWYAVRFDSPENSRAETDALSARLQDPRAFHSPDSWSTALDGLSEAGTA
ncbi:SUKH-4 family immunity protein [Saccharopolyspora sp. NPDC050642]|uniref:SUKH-4 family immunity protein n=1 Tax=Saccharopolyspora sp. NPDC050642 TaxID=3157099 RepID=UPI0033CD7652